MSDMTVPSPADGAGGGWFLCSLWAGLEHGKLLKCLVLNPAQCHLFLLTQTVLLRE